MDGRCTNKNCTLRAAASPVAPKKPAARAKASLKGAVSVKPAAKAANPRRASKCITYNLYDIKDKEPET
jgi:hypothetical protein